MPFFENLPTAEAGRLRGGIIHGNRRQAEFPGIVPVDSLLLGRTDDVAVAVTGLSVFSAGMEIFLTARIRSSAGHGEEHLPGGPRDLAASRRSFRLGLQFADGGQAAGSPGGRGGPGFRASGAGPVSVRRRRRPALVRLPLVGLATAARRAAGVRLRMAGVRHRRIPAGLDAQLVLDAAGRSIRLWPEDEG